MGKLPQGEANLSDTSDTPDTGEEHQKYAEFAARTFASQGQQRSIALALKLAEGELSRECTGEYPVFLLDDVFSELDKRRKEYIMSGFGDRQIILTTCEKNDFADVHDALKIETEDGKFRFTEGLERQFEYDLTEEEKEFRKSYVYSCRKE